MKPLYEASPMSGLVPSFAEEPFSGPCGILLFDPNDRQLVEQASLQLELTPVLLGEGSLHVDILLEYEFIIADESIATSILAICAKPQEQGEHVNPAIIAIKKRDVFGSVSPEHPDHNFDGVLTLPLTATEIAAQVSVILYAHRASARRYQSTWDELHLNRRIFRSVVTGITVASATLPDLPIIYANPAFERMTGYSLEEVRGKNCRFLEGDQRNQPALLVIRDALKNQREATVVLRNFKKDGTPFWNELTLSPVRSREGVLTHFVGIQTDVTVRMDFEAALRQSEKLAAVGRLASSIAHEINNPLESVMNLVFLARHTECSLETKEYLAAADLELRRMKLITAQSLRFSRQSTKPQIVGCTELLDSVLDLYQSRLQNSGVLVERREQPTASLLCMESEIRQVLNNLVSNAIDAMHGKGGRLLIRTRNATDWRNGVRGVSVTLADTGSGISAETMKSIYEAFYTTKGIGGTGLGLWISKEIVERHKGRLLARSIQQERRTGTVFSLFLPTEGILPDVTTNPKSFGHPTTMRDQIKTDVSALKPRGPERLSGRSFLSA